MTSLAIRASSRRRSRGLQLPAEQGVARLKWRGRHLKWSPAGYRQPRVVEPKATLTVLTPVCTVKVLAAGYVPEVHATGGELSRDPAVEASLN